MENVGRRLAALEQQVTKLKLTSRAGGGDPHSKNTDPRRRNFVVDFGGEGIIGADNLGAWNKAIDSYNAGEYDELWCPAGRYVQSGIPKAWLATGDPPIQGVQQQALRGWIHGAGQATELVMSGGAGTFFTVGSGKETFLDFALTQKDPPFRGMSYFSISDFKLTCTDENSVEGEVSAIVTGTNRVYLSSVAGLHVGDPIKFYGPGFAVDNTGAISSPTGIASEYFDSTQHNATTYYIAGILPASDPTDPNSITLSTAPPPGGATVTISRSIITGAGNGAAVGSFVRLNTATTPSGGQNPIVLNKGGHLTVENITCNKTSGIVSVGTGDLNDVNEPYGVNPSRAMDNPIATAARTITAVDTGLEKLTTGAAHGLAVNDPVVFTDDHPLPGNIVDGLDGGYAPYLVETVPSPTTFTLKNRQDNVGAARGAQHNISTAVTGGTFYTGSYDARVQRYWVSNVIGSLNGGTPTANRIDIENGTSGHYDNVQCATSDLGGGRVIYCHPPGSPGASNNDQHWFTDVFVQGGESFWIDIDVTYGDCFNWNLKGCVMDGATNGTVYAHASSGGTGNTITDLWLDHCHCSSRAGVTLHFDKSDTTGIWRNIEINGGRYKFQDNLGLYMHGAGLSGVQTFLAHDVAFLQDQITIIDSIANSNELVSTAGNDGTGHDLQVGDLIRFSTVSHTFGANVTAGPTYCVKEVTSKTRFTVTTNQTGGGVGPRADITANGGAGVLRGKLDAAAILNGAANDVRIHDCEFNGFNSAYMECGNAIQATSLASYNVHDNNATGLRTATFATGLTDTAAHPFHHNSLN
jgi:hypothetical protein